MDGYNPKYNAMRQAGHEHIPLYPKGFIALRIVQLVLAVIILGLAGFGVYGLALTSLCLMLFVAIATLISTIYMIVCHFGNPRLYNYWAIMSLDIFLLIFWLISFALLASNVAYVFGYGGTTYYDYWSDSYYTEGLSGFALAWASCIAAAAGLGGVEFALFLTSLAMHSVAMHRHRKAGLHCSPLEAGAAGTTTVTATPQTTYQPVSQTGYMAQPTAYNNGTAYDPVKTASPMPHQQSAYPPPMPQPAPVYPQAAPTPLTAQPTGGSYVNNAYEVPTNQMHH